MLALLTLLFSASSAGWGTFHGDSGWNENGLFLIVAEVSGEVRLIDEDSELYEAQIRPIATFAGSFDPTATERIKVWTPAGGPMGRPHTHVPKEGDFILAVILHRFDGRYIVSAGNTQTFMPRGAAMVVVDSLDDPNVARTVAEVRRRRAHPAVTRAEADKLWATWPDDQDAIFRKENATPFRGVQEPATRPGHDVGEPQD